MPRIASGCLVACLLTAVLAQAQSGGTAAIRGQILAAPERLAEPLEVVLRRGGKTLANTLSDSSGVYEFHNLDNGTYDVVVKSKGKEARQRAELGCRPNGMTYVVVVLDRKDTPRVSVYFPIEDPDVVDVSELGRDYPKDIRKDYERALEDSRSGNVSRAIRRLEDLAKRAPDFYNAHTRLGMLYQNLGCYRDAEEHYILARELSPRSAQPLVNLASVHIQAADTGLDMDAHRDQARIALEQAIRIKPNSAIAYCLLGSLYYNSASYEEAEKNLTRAIGIQSRLAAAQLMLANVYMKQEKWKAALEKLDIYLDQNPLAPDLDSVRNERAKVAKNLK